MVRIERPEQLQPLLAAQLKRGVYTNQPLTADWSGEIAAGLAAEPFDGGLWIARRRGDHDLLSVYLQPGAVPPPPATARPAVLEAVWRERDAEAAASALERLQAAGFRERFRRLRRTRPAETAPEDGGGCRFPGPEETAAVLAFLEDQFDRLTGCLPSETQLSAALARREVACLTDGRGVGGALHFARGRRSWEIRHLALRADLRGRGLAKALLSACLRETGGQACQVWAREGNIPAETFYQTHGFRPDGWRSAVLSIGKGAVYENENCGNPVGDLPRGGF